MHLYDTGQCLNLVNQGIKGLWVHYDRRLHGGGSLGDAALAAVEGLAVEGLATVK